MQKTRSALIVILMITAALAGCISEDTSDLDTQIEDLDTQNTELTQTIAERDLAISELEATIAGLESNVAGLEASIPLMEEQRDALLALLSDSQEFANQTIVLAEAMNETIAGLHAMLGENATLVQQLQSDLAIQQSLVAQWQQTAEDNRADLSYAHLFGVGLGNADLSGADLIGANLGDADLIGANLSGANLEYADLTRAVLAFANMSGANLENAYLTGVYWNDTTCPDGTNSDNNGDTCENNL